MSEASDSRDLDELSRRTHEAMLKGLESGMDVDEIADAMAKLWSGRLSRRVCKRSLRAVLRRLTAPAQAVYSASVAERRDQDTKEGIKSAPANRMEPCELFRPGVYARLGAVERVLAHLGLIKKPEDQVWGPSPIRRAWRACRLGQILKGLGRRHE